jgi:hypothetical protein
MNRIHEFAVLGRDRAILRVADVELWGTDLTSAGTAQLQQLRHRAYNLAVVHGRAWLAGNDFVVGGSFGWEPWMLDPGATQQQLGTPCAGSGTFTPQLYAQHDPRLGRTLELRGGTAGARVATLLVGLPALTPVPLPGSRCFLHVDPLGVQSIAPLPLDARGRFQLAFTLPATPALVDLEVAAQAVYWSGRGPLGADLSAGLLLRLGD